VATLKKFITSQGKLMSRKRTGLSASTQKALARAVKRARFMALLPYVGD
jgi:small subunit ribosomal protein S18